MMVKIVANLPHGGMHAVDKRKYRCVMIKEHSMYHDYRRIGHAFTIG